MNSYFQLFRQSDGKVRIRALIMLLLIVAGSIIGVAQALRTETWTAESYGAVHTVGSSVYDAGTDTFSISGSGGGLESMGDQLQLVHQSFTGNGEIVARVLSVSPAIAGTHSWGHVMLRGATDRGAAGVGLSVDHKGIVKMSARTYVGTSTHRLFQSHPNNAVQFPVWLKLSRSGSKITGFSSQDGLTWTEIASIQIDLRATTCVGIGASSGDRYELTTSLFDNVRVGTAPLRQSSPTGQTALQTPAGLKLVSKTDVSVELEWTPAPEDSGIVGYHILCDGKIVGTTALNAFTHTQRKPSTTYLYRVKAFDAGGKLSTSTPNLRVTTLPKYLQHPWQHEDFGIVGIPGQTQIQNPQISITASGLELGVHQDHFHYLFQEAAGNFEATAELFRPAGGKNNSIGSLMIREKAGSEGRAVGIGINQQGDLILNYRTFKGTKKQIIARKVTQTWAKLVRLGERIHAYTSQDGTNWKFAGTIFFSSNYKLSIGFAVCSYDNAFAATANFRSFSIRSIEDTQHQPEDSSGSPGAHAPAISAFEEIAQLPILQPVVNEGNWVERFGALINFSGRGAIEYDITLPEPGIYNLQVTGQLHMGEKDAIFPLDISIDGQWIDRLNLFCRNGRPDAADLATPWLKAGVHRLRIFNDNAKNMRLLQINKISLRKILGPNADGDAFVDWIEHRLASQNSILPIDSSITSPACIEGKTRYLSMMKLSKGLPQQGAGDLWFANVSLSASQPTTIRASFENGGIEKQVQVSWKETNVLNSGNLTIRKNDSLLLNAVNGSSRTGATSFVITDPSGNIQNLASTAVVPLAEKFSTPGIHKVQATHAGKTATIEVKVVQTELGESPAAMINVKRVWDCPGIAPEAILQIDPRMTFEASRDLPGGGKQFEFRVDSFGKRTVVARLGSNGPILDSVAINCIALYSGDQTGFEVVETLPDGTRIVELTLAVNGNLDELSFLLDVFANGLTFEDGSVSRWITAADFDFTGRARIRFIASNDTHSGCHKLQVFQNGKLVGVN
jgi:regulation of enolase protein 1 (concanavalin A-like superfamily)